MVFQRYRAWQILELDGLDTRRGRETNLFSKQGFVNDDLNGAKSSVELTAWQPALVTVCQKCRV